VPLLFKFAGPWEQAVPEWPGRGRSTVMLQQQGLLAGTGERTRGGSHTGTTWDGVAEVWVGQGRCCTGSSTGSCTAARHSGRAHARECWHSRVAHGGLHSRVAHGGLAQQGGAWRAGTAGWRMEGLHSRVAHGGLAQQGGAWRACTAGWRMEGLHSRVPHGGLAQQGGAWRACTAGWRMEGAHLHAALRGRVAHRVLRNGQHGDRAADGHPHGGRGPQVSPPRQRAGAGGGPLPPRVRAPPHGAMPPPPPLHCLHAAAARVLCTAATATPAPPPPSWCSCHAAAVPLGCSPPPAACPP
jgi:hypothetical protein